MTDSLERLRGYNPIDRTSDNIQAAKDIADAADEIARLREEVDLHKSRAICELADEGDEANHECGWVVCGVCWNNAASAHRKVAEQLKEQLAEAQARNASLSGQLVAADDAMEQLRAECERLRNRPTMDEIVAKYFEDGEAAAAGGPDEGT